MIRCTSTRSKSWSPPLTTDGWNRYPASERVASAQCAPCWRHGYRGAADLVNRTFARTHARPVFQCCWTPIANTADGAQDGTLHRIAPRRFNPGHRAWLPIMHIDRDGWHLTLLFSNTARAHQLGKTDDWVVVYFDGDAHHEGQCTIVTETSGLLKGQRVVRGREQEQALAS